MQIHNERASRTSREVTSRATRLMRLSNVVVRCASEWMDSLRWQERSNFARTSNCRLLASCLLALVSLMPPTVRAQVGYRYDVLGRLIQAIAPDGRSVLYRYDAAGNLLTVQRVAANALAISGFSPTFGAPGAVITVYGSAFAPTPNGNTVTFGGTSAVVSSASANDLVVTVPPGAVTGNIAVTTSAGTVQSANTFVIGTNQPPSISSISPELAVAGTVVTITGSNFQTIPERNKAAFGGFSNSAILSGPTTSSIQAKVPTLGLPAGPIAVTTPSGVALSASDVYVVPQGVPESDIAFRTRILLGGPPVTIALPPAPKKALVLIDGQQGQRLNLITGSGTFSQSLASSLYSPDGVILGSPTLPNNGATDISNSIADTPLRRSGTHTLLLSNTAASEGSIAVSALADIEGGVLPLNGPASVLAQQLGQDIRYTFSASAGANILIEVAATWSVSPSGNGMLFVRTPNGSYQMSTSFWDNVSWSLSNLPTTGNYELFIYIPGVASGQVQTRLATSP